MKWFELIRHKYGCETVMLHVPYQGEGQIAPNMRDYVVKQLKNRDPDAGAHLRRQVRHRPAAPIPERTRSRPRTTWSRVLRAAKNRPRRSTPTSAAVYYIGPIFTAFRGTTDAVEYYDLVRKEIEQRIREGRARSRRTAT